MHGKVGFRVEIGFDAEHATEFRNKLEKMILAFCNEVWTQEEQTEGEFTFRARNVRVTLDDPWKRSEGFVGNVIPFWVRTTEEIAEEEEKACMLRKPKKK